MKSGLPHSFILRGNFRKGYLLKTTEIITALTAQEITRLGYTLIDVEFQKEQGDWVLTLFVDKEGGVTIEDCECVSRAIEPIIDEADPIAQSYFLSVSSPGLDRPLKNENDYLRNINKDIAIKLYVKKDGIKEFSGRIKTCEAGSICIACKDGKEREFQLKEIAQAKPIIEF